MSRDSESGQRTMESGSDGKLKIVSKEEIKEQLGRSPDFADTLMMRMWFELDRTPEPGIRFL